MSVAFWAPEVFAVSSLLHRALAAELFTRTAPYDPADTTMGASTQHVVCLPVNVRHFAGSSRRSCESSSVGYRRDEFPPVVLGRPEENVVVEHGDTASERDRDYGHLSASADRSSSSDTSKRASGSRPGRNAGDLQLKVLGPRPNTIYWYTDDELKASGDRPRSRYVLTSGCAQDTQSLLQSFGQSTLVAVLFASSAESNADSLIVLGDVFPVAIGGLPSPRELTRSLEALGMSPVVRALLISSPHSLLDDLLQEPTRSCAEHVLLIGSDAGGFVTESGGTPRLVGFREVLDAAGHSFLNWPEVVVPGVVPSRSPARVSETVAPTLSPRLSWRLAAHVIRMEEWLADLASRPRSAMVDSRRTAFVAALVALATTVLVVLALKVLGV